MEGRKGYVYEITGGARIKTNGTLNFSVKKSKQYLTLRKRVLAETLAFICIK